MRHISSLPYNAVSLLYVFVLNYYKPMVWDIGPWVCHCLIETHIVMNQHCIGGSWFALFMGYGGLKGMHEGGPQKSFSSESLITLQYETSVYKVWVQATFDICCQTWCHYRGLRLTVSLTLRQWGRLAKNAYFCVLHHIQNNLLIILVPII